MRMHDVEGRVLDVERVDVARREAHCVGAALGAQRLGLRDHLVGTVDADDGARRDACGEIQGDRAGPAADVEEVETGFEAVEEVRGGVLRGAPLVTAQHRLVVPVSVGLGHAPIFTSGRMTRPGIDGGSDG